MLLFYIVLCLMTNSLAEDSKKIEISHLDHFGTHGLGSTCGMITDCSHILGSECVDGVCQCVSPFKQNDDQKCVMGSTCTSDKNCTKVNGAICSTSDTCICPDMHVLKGRECAKSFIDQICSTDEDCKTSDLKCTESKCKCRDGTLQDDHQCIASSGIILQMSTRGMWFLAVVLLNHANLI